MLRTYLALLLLPIAASVIAQTPEIKEVPPTPATTPAPATSPAASAEPTPVPAPPAAPAPLPMTLVLPTDNDALVKGDLPNFYMFVDRSVGKERITVWEGGSYGFVRNPVLCPGGNIVCAHFHEGMDVAPAKRDEKGEPLDEVRSISHGEVVHCATSGQGDYGRYVVIKHDWGQGPFFTLYAHLKSICVKEGDKVEPKTPIGILGYTGRGIDKRRAHTHVEMDMILSERFSDWHDANFGGNPNSHGPYNGFNLAGFNFAEFYLAYLKNPALTVVDYLKTLEIGWKVNVPRVGDLEIIKNYPWLAEGIETPSPSWEISFNEAGVPLKIKPSTVEVKSPQLAWVKPSPIPYLYHTRYYVSGVGEKATLSSNGVHYVQLVTGEFSSASKTEVRKAESAPKPVVKSKKKK